MERGILPPTELNVDVRCVGLQEGEKILEVLVHLKNKGSSALVTRGIWVDVLYLEKEDNLRRFADPNRGLLIGRLDFPRSVKKSLPREAIEAAYKSALIPIASKKKQEEPRGLPLLGHKTFVQPSVEQTYTCVTSVPEATTFVLVWAGFEYEPKPSPLQSRILTISRKLGLIQYSLEHVEELHTVERVFRVDSVSS